MTMIVHPGIDECDQALRSLMEDRVLVLDGAMGTMVQALRLNEVGRSRGTICESSCRSDELCRHSLFDPA